MAPHAEPRGGSWVLNETDTDTDDKSVRLLVPPEASEIKFEVVWRNVIYFVILHIGGVYGGYLFFTKIMWTTFFFGIVFGFCSGLGITAGAHRLWAHRAYKAKLPLRVLLAIFNTMAFQDSVIHWARDHRMHHKYSETDADPHNATRGFFFSHVWWLCVRKHPEIKSKGHTVDMSDLWADPVLRFQKRCYLPLMLLWCVVIPAYIPTLWNESLSNAIFVCVFFRYCVVVNFTWLINSAAHIWGQKPYDKNIKPVETKFISFLTLGEGFHNYHHTFPWDYKTAELGNYRLNYTKIFIDVMAYLGLAYDLKTVPTETIEKRVKRTGDGSHVAWDWDNTNIFNERKEEILTAHPEKSD